KASHLVIDEFDLVKLNLHGCSEILNEPISDKSLTFKVDIHLKSLIKNESLFDDPSMQDLAQAKDERNEILQNQTRRIGPPLELESDCWLIVRGSAKKIAGRWTIKLRGPPPEFGRWVRADLQNVEESTWRWVPSQPDRDPFIREEGAWYATGQRPEYSPLGWVFGGKVLQLTFYYNNESYGSKVHTDQEGTLVTASDSQTAIRALSELDEAEEKKKKALVQSAESIKFESPVKATESEVKWVDSLNIQGDLWNCSEKPKWVSGGWMVKLRYPDGDRGRWVAHQDGDDEPAERSWKWKPADQEDNPVSWVFTGQIPKLQNHDWVFFGKKMEFVGYQGDQHVGVRFSTDSHGQLHVAKDTSERISKLSVKKKKNSEKKQDAKVENNSFINVRAAEGQFSIGPALLLESDCWILGNRKPKFIAGGWMIKLSGPGSIMGRWISVDAADPLL
ncbi:MAG: hypothetical protein AABZ55_12595, partial [Bdellovibrionota bacterium]